MLKDVKCSLKELIHLFKDINVLMAFRTKVSRVTSFTPYKLLFGREINNLEHLEREG